GIMMGYISTDEAVIFSGELPTIAVMAPLERSPQSLLYDPEDFPDLTWDNLAEQEDATVLYFEGSMFVEYLVGAGIVDPDQTDAAYDGSTSRFVTADNIVQSGFVSNDVYKDEHLIEEWGGRPVGHLLVDDSGYRAYNSSMSVTPENLETHRDCIA